MYYSDYRLGTLVKFHVTIMLTTEQTRAPCHLLVITVNFLRVTGLWTMDVIQLIHGVDMTPELIRMVAIVGD